MASNEGWGGTSSLLQGSRNPAAPAGLRQTGERLATAQQNYDQGRSVLRPWMPAHSMLETAKSWYTGANNEGTRNGWDTTFYQNMFAQQDQYQQQAAQANKPSQYFDWLNPEKNPTATGVQTWGADPTDTEAKARGESRFGDIYNNGKKVANLYDDYDRATADVMIGEFLFSNDEKTRAWKTPGLDPSGKPTLNPEYSKMVEEKRVENTNYAVGSKTQESFAERVEAKEREIREGWGDEALIAAGALGTGLTAGAAGAAIGAPTGVGALIGGAIGAVGGAAVGGISAYLNQDQLVEMEARAQVRADQANEKFSDSWMTRNLMHLGEQSELAGKLLIPGSNIVQGLNDVRYGSVGDMTSEFYEVDKDQNRVVRGAWVGADIAATLGDGVLQMASPLGNALYMGTMGLSIAGNIGEMSTGTVFNDRRGIYDPLENKSEWAAAIFSTGIDAAQVGVAGVFAKAARSSRGLVTGEKAASKYDPLATGGLYEDAASVLDKGYTGTRRWLSKSTGKEVVEGAATRARNLNGMRFVTNAEGRVLSVRPTLEALAPSESLRWIETGWAARKLARIDEGAMTRDHMMKAAMDLQQNSRFRQAVLLGYTEGAEEAAQAWLDPKTTGDKGKWTDYALAALYGGAGGMGMGLGRVNRRPPSKQQMQQRAFVQHSIRTGHIPTKEEWEADTKGNTPADWEKLARTDPKEDEETFKLYNRIADNHRQENATHSVLGYYALDTMNQSKFEDLHRKALEEGNGSLVLLGMSTEFLTTNKGTVEMSKFSANAGVMSATETINQIGQIYKGTKAQLAKVNEELAELPATSTDEHIEALRAERKARQADLLEQQKVAADVSDHFRQRYDEFASEANPTVPNLTRHIERLNTELRNAYMGGWRDKDGNLLDDQMQKRVQRAVEIKLGRHPLQDKGSLAVVMPQVSVELSRLNAQAQIHVQQGMLKAINGDHDGDTIVPLHTTYFNDEDLGRIRRGDQYMQPTVDDETKKTTVKVIIANPDGEYRLLNSFADSMLDGLSRSAMTTAMRLDGLTKQIKAEFSQVGAGPLDDDELEKILTKFTESVFAGREDSRMNLVTEMVNLDYPGMRNHRPDDNVPSVQWLWNKINETWDILSKDLAHVRATEEVMPSITPEREARETVIREGLARRDAATASATLGTLTSDPVRGTQHLHYSVLYRGLTEFDPAATMTSDQQMALTKLFMELGSSQTDRDIELLARKNAVEERVYYWLSQMAYPEGRDSAKEHPEVLLLLANTSVPSVDMKGVNKFEVTHGETTMLQLLLRRSLDIEENLHRATAEDSPEKKRIRSLRRLTYREADRTKRSYTASLAMIEVLGNRPLHELTGNSSAYVGSLLTLNQLIQLQRGLHPTERNKEWDRFRRQPAYIKEKDRGFKDAPWPESVLADTDTKISAYAILMDAVKVAGDTYVDRMKGRSNTIHERFKVGLESLHTILDSHKKMHHARLAAQGITDPVAIFRDALSQNARLAPEIAANLVPDAAALGIFQIHPNGKVTSSPWLEKALVERDREKAIASYYFNVKFAEFLQKAGTVDMSAIDKLEAKDKSKQIELADVRGKINPNSLNSRFLQVLFHLASQPDGIERDRFLREMDNATSLDQMFDTINNEPMWRNNQAELIPWYDDVSDFEVDPSDIWSSNMNGALQRENIRTWSKRMQALGSAALEAQVIFEADKNLLHGIEQWQMSQASGGKVIDIHDGAVYGGLLKRAVENRKIIPDYQGQAARTQLVELQMMGIAANQNKGVADPKAAPFGEPLITLDSFGFSDGLRQELASLTAEDVEDVLTNLSKLAQGPVPIQMADGSELTFDITTDVKARKMLQDPRTQGLAMSILFPTVRDVDKNNTVQTYMDTDAKTSIDNKGYLARMLRESNFKHLFDKQATFEDELKQAHRYIGTLEAYVRNEAVGNDNPAVQDKAFMPLQKTIHDFITAYLHSKDVQESNYPNIRNQMFVDVANTMKAVASVDPGQLGRMRNTIAGVLEKRFLADSTNLDRLKDDDVIAQQLEEIQRITEESDIYFKGLDDIDQRIKTAPTKKVRKAAEIERLEYVREYEQQKGNFGDEHLTFLDAVSAMTMFQSGKGKKTRYNQAEILAYLGSADRIHRIFRKETYKVGGLEINAQRLYDKYIREYDQNYGPQEYSPEEWDVLANWAAQIYLEDSTSRASFSVPTGPSWLGEEGAAVKRYSDQSWMYLTDVFFDDSLLRAANYVSDQGTYYPPRRSQDVADELTTGILSEQKLGTWTRVIVDESMKYRMILKNSTVGAAVAQEGNDPKVMADYIGAGKVTYERPEPGHFSDTILDGAADQRLAELLTKPLALVQLENHFVSQVMVESADPNNPLDPALGDAFGVATVVNETNETTRKAGALGTGEPPLRVLDLDKLDSHIEWLKDSHDLGAYRIKIKFVDVNKQPHEREWVNNIFFDGAGREAVGGSSVGAVASLFFGLNGLNKVGQQNPLDAATKKGMAFRPHKRTTLDEAKLLEPAGSRVAEILAAKAVHMLNKKYPMGELLQADLPSLYKLAKMRHVVVGKNANGEKEVWWPEKFIELEEASYNIPLTDYKLVRLSDRVAQTLLGRSGVMGVKGTRGAIVRPTFNIADLDTFPDLSMERLTRLGLDRIGEAADLGNTVLAQVNYPTREVSMYMRGESYDSLYTRRLMEYQGQAKEVNTRRSHRRDTGEGKLDISENNRAKSQLVRNMLDAEKQALTATALGIPERGVLDMRSYRASQQVAAQLGKLMRYPNSMTWVHKHGAQGDLSLGLVGAADIKDNFAGLDGMGPVYGDVVILDLSDLMSTVDSRSYVKAAEEAAKILKAYAKRGVTVALQSTGGQLDLRAKVTEDLVDGSLGYEAIADSAHFFAPITEEGVSNAAQRALGSSLVDSPQYNTKNMSLRVVSDDISTDLSEQTEYVDVEHDRTAHAIACTVMPYRLLSTGTVGERQALAYNEPPRGPGQADVLQKVNAQLLPILKDPEGRKYLKKLFGDEKLRKHAMDDGYPQYKELPNGTIEHGVLSLDDAFDKLQQTIEANGWPLDVGETFYWGTIVPMVSGDGSIHLARVGFEQPDNDTIQEHWQERYNDKNRRISASTNKLDANQTRPPPTRVDEVQPGDTGMEVFGTYVPNPLAKGVDEGLGLKTGQTPMPTGFSFPDVDIAASGAAGMRPSRMAGTTTVIGKEARGGLGNNLRDLFMITGINFEDDMINFLFGSDPGRSEATRNELWDMTSSILKDWSYTDHGYTAEDLARMLDDRSSMMAFEMQLNATGRSVAKDQWKDVNLRWTKETKQPPQTRLATILLMTLAAPGVRLEHVIGTAGATTVSDHSKDLLVRQLPSMMTEALNDKEYPELRRTMVSRLNRNMPVDPNGDPLMWFDEQLHFNIRMQQELDKVKSAPKDWTEDLLSDGTLRWTAPQGDKHFYKRTDGTVYREELVTGFLQAHVPLPADENSIRLAYSAVDSSGKESQHVANTIYATSGGRVATKTKPANRKNIPDALDELYGDNEIERFVDPESSAAAFYHVMTRLRTGGRNYSPWQKRTPMEESHHHAMQGKLRQYGYHGLRTPETGWSDSEKTTGNDLALELLKKFNIGDQKAVPLVEEMARQLMGLPGPATDQTDYHERMSFKVFQTSVLYMLENVKKGYNPLYGGVVPRPHEMTWKRIFDAQQGKKKGQQWLPLANGNRKGKQYVKADDWGQWVDALGGQMQASDALFDATFRTDLDAFFHTYQGTHPDYMDMAPSTDMQLSLKLLDEDVNQPFMKMDVLSVDPGYDAILREPVVLPSQHMTYDALVGKGAVTTRFEAEEASDSVIARRIKVMTEWQKNEGLPKQEDTSVREYMKQGVAYRESSSSTTNLMRNVVNASVMMRLFNPALYASAAFEVPFRSAMEGFTNILTGQLTGKSGLLISSTAAKLEDQLTKLGMKGVNLQPRYSVADINLMDKLNKTMGRSNKFKGHAYQEIAYQSSIAGGRGRVGGLLERGASWAALTTSDPTRGLPQPTLAKRYNDAAWEYLVMKNAQITLDQYVFEMNNDPLWLSKLDPTADRMGLNAVQQSRGAKNTMVGNTIMAPVDWATSNKNLFINGAGHLLKIPFIFTRFNANMMLTLTGLHGFDQVAAMFFDGRQQPQVIKKMMARAKHGKGAEVDPEYWDMADIIESIDLSRAFVRGAVTQTALMSMALMAGGFSLGGEDEEERRRKRMAEYLHTPYYHDPRKASNDFRWTDAVFLDNVPVLGSIVEIPGTDMKIGGWLKNETGRAAVVPHWIFRQFLSPVLGMMRFFETGDVYEIAHGFHEAATVLPTSVTRLWAEAQLTTELIMEEAAADDNALTPAMQEKKRQLLMNVVFLYEKALFENSFVNGLYRAGDDFDRNPWAVVSMKNGVVQTEPGTNEPLATDALRSTLTGEEGTESIKDKYMTRTGWDGLRHQYAEGNATAAFVMSILPWIQGDDSTYLRGNMVTKKQYVQLDQTPKSQLEALVYATYLGKGGQDFLTKDEIIGMIKQREQAAGRWWKQGEVEAEADKVYETYKDKPLTVFDKGGKEVMTLDGKAGVFRSLRDGVMTLDHPAIRGFNVSQEERNALAEELMTELTQEGVDLGLSDQAAGYRARRIWFGDQTKGFPGLKWILYDKKIPSKPYAEYDQLNVTYALGPDGKPWATPFQRANVLQVLGIPLPHTMPPTIPNVTSYDQRGNVIDLVRGINTGLAAVVPRPVADDIKANDDAVKKAEAKTYTPGGKTYKRSGWRNFGRRGYGRRGFGGGGGGFGGGGGGRPFYSQLRALPQGTSARMDDVPMINTSNPIIRRADVRRERITSERGRLKQWQ